MGTTITEPNARLFAALVANRSDEAMWIITTERFNPNGKVNGDPLIIWAAVSGDALAVRALIDRGANVNERGNDGLSAIWYARFYAGKGEERNPHNDVLDVLIANGAKENKTDSKIELRMDEKSKGELVKAFGVGHSIKLVRSNGQPLYVKDVVEIDVVETEAPRTDVKG
ncbi:MAG: hypothetical protein ABSE71_00045 [Candidatus Micrarchaeaceae archaeon]|jgi:hypothetical protein|nr:hypothetical protein [Candidatus Micrarchaeota archaeon]HII09534.1 hypothetical protein [Candidatus Micrarchaeota archaeon]